MSRAAHEPLWSPAASARYALAPTSAFHAVSRASETAGSPRQTLPYMPTKGTEFLRVPAVSLRRRSIASYRARSIPRLHFGQITDFLGNKSLYGQCQLGLCTLSASLNCTGTETGPEAFFVGL